MKAEKLHRNKRHTVKSPLPPWKIFVRHFCLPLSVVGPICLCACVAVLFEARIKSQLSFLARPRRNSQPNGVSFLLSGSPESSQRGKPKSSRVPQATKDDARYITNQNQMWAAGRSLCQGYRCVDIQQTQDNGVFVCFRQVVGSFRCHVLNTIQTVANNCQYCTFQKLPIHTRRVILFTKATPFLLDTCMTRAKWSTMEAYFPLEERTTTPEKCSMTAAPLILVIRTCRTKCSIRRICSAPAICTAQMV